MQSSFSGLYRVLLYYISLLSKNQSPFHAVCHGYEGGAGKNADEAFMSQCLTTKPMAVAAMSSFYRGHGAWTNYYSQRDIKQLKTSSSKSLIFFFQSCWSCASKTQIGCLVGSKAIFWLRGYANILVGFYTMNLSRLQFQERCSGEHYRS